MKKWCGVDKPLIFKIMEPRKYGTKSNGRSEFTMNKTAAIKYDRIELKRRISFQEPGIGHQLA